MRPRNILITSALALAAIVAGGWLYIYRPLGIARGYGLGPMGYGHMGAGGMGGMMMIFLWGLVLVILILMINWILGQGRDERFRPPTALDAEEILKRRYAEGTIDKSEFKEKMNDLREVSLGQTKAFETPATGKVP